MTSISPLQNILTKGLYGDYKEKNRESLIKIKEVKDLLIVQIVQYKNSSLQIKDVNIDGLNFTEEPLKVNSNKDSRVLWCGPKNWLFVSSKKILLKNIQNNFDQKEFAITDLSHSRTIIEIEGKNSKELLKKGCPFNFNEMIKDVSVNSLFNGITITIDMLNDNPDKIRLFALRSFGESLYHSITDASLEFGYEVI
tara:strand:- start:6 stop:593 length:588 start_codon:yes stop_codon:yes gene_type:complete